MSFQELSEIRFLFCRNKGPVKLIHQVKITHLFLQSVQICSISPCIMCVQYRGGAQYRGVFSTVGDILSTVGGVQYRGGYHDKCGGYLEYRGGVQYHGGYHKYHGGLSDLIVLSLFM